MLLGDRGEAERRQELRQYGPGVVKGCFWGTGEAERRPELRQYGPGVVKGCFWGTLATNLTG